MDTNALKKFAQSARNLAIDQVTAKLALVLDASSPVRREHAAAIKKLDAAIAQNGKQQVIEQVAYTWFNRFTALRFMDANGYTNPRVVSPADGATRPEILSEALAGNLPDGAPDAIAALLSGRTPSNDPQAEAYRLLLVHACNQWHGPMPFLFEQIDDFTELLMPEDLLSQTSILAELRKVMTEGACQDVEIIGWLYQFYISEKKDQVFAGLKKNVKITAENIPAATQLFTPHWIVRYLVENSLGRLWLLNRPASTLASRMDYYIAPVEAETDFLRITRVEDIRICDPACGSGHMLTYAFDLLYAIYAEEGYEADTIPALILTHNLTGVEIDDRAGALAAFALVMKAAARLGRRRFLRMGVTPDICVLQNVSFTAAEMQDVAAVVGRDLFTNELRETLGQFEQAKNFGSLIVPHSSDPAETLRVVAARDFAGDLLLKDVQARVVVVLRMAEALSPKYHVVVANPPYMGAGGMNSNLIIFSKTYYKDSKADLFAMFLERTVAMTQKSGFSGAINLPSWLFLSSFEKLRKKLLLNTTIVSLLHMGRGIFGIDWGSTAFVLNNIVSKNKSGSFFRLHKRNFQHIKPEDIATLYRRALRDPDFHFDFGKYRDESGTNEIPEDSDTKGEKLYFSFKSSALLEVPGAPIAYWISVGLRNALTAKRPLKDHARALSGMRTGDNNRFLRFWYEPSKDKFGTDGYAEEKKWFPYNKGGDFRKWFGNADLVVNWASGGSEIKELTRENYPELGDNLSWKISNEDCYFRTGITWGGLSSTDLSFRWSDYGALFDSNKGAMMFPSDDEGHLVLGYLNSKIPKVTIKAINPTMSTQNSEINILPYFSNEIRQREEKLKDVVGNVVSAHKSDWDAYETSWDFTTLPLLHPDHRVETMEHTYTTLRTHWQGMTDEMQRLEEENNSIFIDAYGLQDELTPEVPLNEITLTCNPAYRYGGNASIADRETRLRADTVAEYLSYAVGCMFGRYSLDAPGLILANQGETLANYLARVPDPQFMPDKDNVIPVLDADWFADDITDRFRQFLRVSFGEDTFRENLRFIEDALGKDIRKYFTKDFYADHVKRYKKRPIYWQFASPKGSFQALIYMHRYRPDTVSVLLNEYLRAYLSKLEAERARLDQLADDASATQAQRTKALKDASAIAKQLDELNEWEREVVFPLAQQKIEIDLDAGVKANYPLFGAALKKIPGLEATDE
ncbi:BREX-1 system adenine-specific DNA-methyltransferase PglX [Paracoccaceae bacterium Fryx2]|nr:BREX-1 system adenine-specific DNA-methyltransferase PglX [Paracoccaceae bacterium Fryx2]